MKIWRLQQDTNTYARYENEFDLDDLGNLKSGGLKASYLDISKSKFKMSAATVNKADKVFVLKNKHFQSPLLKSIRIKNKGSKIALCDIYGFKEGEPNVVYVNLVTGEISEPLIYADGYNITTSGDIVSVNEDMSIVDTGYDYDHAMIRFKYDKFGKRTAYEPLYPHVVRIDDGKYKVSSTKMYGVEVKILCDYEFANNEIIESYINNPNGTFETRVYKDICQYSDGIDKVLIETKTGSLLQRVDATSDFDLEGRQNFDTYYNECLQPKIAKIQENQKTLTIKDELDDKQQVLKQPQNIKEYLEAKLLKKQNKQLSEIYVDTPPIVKKQRRNLKQIVSGIKNTINDFSEILSDVSDSMYETDRTEEYSEEDKIKGAFIASELLDTPVAGFYAYNQMEEKNDKIRKKQKEQADKEDRSM